jgi:hypothetical protein
MSNPSPPRKFQFSLHQLLVATALVAVVLAIGFSAWAGLLAAFFFWMLPTPLVVAAVYGRGEIRTAAIGALVPIVPAILRGPWDPAQRSLLMSVLWMAFSAAICGAVAVVTRRWLIRRGHAEGD